ncbi:DNA-binding FadR family transcriptional regulator [Kribbella amoyensis]|uniref:DNA-binding FadR family transcriptional regulator n=1 Tax=Kribbella amoyensis TaxID=996641 RepID=A0A561B7C2_9ACTN|nr:FCD domain-containing protein [Kribbella amoyensis]TWD74866.1 DNA-binding FadR family transcriptional regulator [Kribbella amoyensis]
MTGTGIRRGVSRGLHGQIVEVMAQRILSGQIPEGATINVPALQADLGVSLTAVREALKVLTAKGLVDARQKRGTFVRPRSDWNLLDADMIRWQFSDADNRPELLEQLHEVRGIVEPAAARLAALRAEAEHLQALDEALAAMAAATDDLAAVTADLAFHKALLSATGNELLTKMEVIMETGLADRDRLVHKAKPSDDPVPSHQRVVAAVRAGDPEGAELAMRELLAKAAEDLTEARGSRGRK